MHKPELYNLNVAKWITFQLKRKVAIFICLFFFFFLFERHYVIKSNKGRTICELFKEK